MELFKKFVSRKVVATAGGVAALPLLPESLSWPVAIVLAAYIDAQRVVAVTASKGDYSPIASSMRRTTVSETL